MVHPSVVTADRTMLANLIATNFFGINSAIAATEAPSMQMWAGNTVAMLGYHAATCSWADHVVPPFTPAFATTQLAWPRGR